MADSLPPLPHWEQAPVDIPGAIRRIKAALRARITASGRTPEDVFAVVEQRIKAEVDEIIAASERGDPVWPAVDYTDIEAGSVPAATRALAHRRGCLIVRGHFGRDAFRHVFDGTIERYDPWDPAYRTAGPQYDGSTICSAFRTFQGWTALSDMAHDQGVLHTVPVSGAMAGLLLRPLLADVPGDDMCGVTTSRAFPVSDVASAADPGADPGPRCPGR